MMTIDPLTSPVYKVDRVNLFTDVLEIYRGKFIDREYPLQIEYKNEIAMDLGGVSRDVFSAFWEHCYQKLFDGSGLLVPMTSAQLDTSDDSILPLIGKILSHGYLACGFLPTRIAFPCIVGILCGPRSACANAISESILLESFADFVSLSENTVLKDALHTKSTFSNDVQERLLNILARYGCRVMPTPANLKRSLLQISRFQFINNPTAAIAQMNRGVPSIHAQFWQSQSLEAFHSIYTTVAASNDKVLAIVAFPESMNPAEERVTGYLTDMLGNMPINDLRRFLRFCTGSSVIVVKELSVQFNRISGLERRPIAHTCDCMLELPVSYVNYSDFHNEWMAVLNSDSDLRDFCWEMHSV